MEDRISEYEKARQDAYAPLVERLSPKWTEKIFIFSISCGLGWKKIVFKLVEDLDKIWEGVNGKKGCENWILLQAKEKMGGLRFYTEHPDHVTKSKETFAAIKQAADEAWKTCERCGDAGRTTSEGGRIATVCEACEKRWKERSSKGEWDALFG